MHYHDHPHPHVHSTKPLLLTLGLTGGFAVIEAAGGWIAGSLALLGDAGHMVTDSMALVLALLAARIASTPPSAQHSYGLGRAEAIAALINGLFMIAIVVGIAISAVERLQSPRPVEGGVVIWVATFGLIVNILAVFVLSHGEQTLNTRGALLHVIGDLLGSIAALISGAVIYVTGWTPIDPILSFVICVLILYSGVRLLRDVLHIIMEGVPLDIDLPDVGMAMAAVPGVNSVHDLHIWTLSTGRIALSAHLLVNDIAHWPRVLDSETRLLRDKFGVDHITLQPEPVTQIVDVRHLLENNTH